MQRSNCPRCILKWAGADWKMRLQLGVLSKTREGKKNIECWLQLFELGFNKDSKYGFVGRVFSFSAEVTASPMMICVLKTFNGD